MSALGIIIELMCFYKINIIEVYYYDSVSTGDQPSIAAQPTPQSSVPEQVVNTDLDLRSTVPQQDIDKDGDAASAASAATNMTSGCEDDCRLQ